MSLSLFTDLTVEQFASEVWGRRPSLTRAAHRPHDPAMFDTAIVDALISQHALRTPFIRIAKDGTVLSDRSFTGGAGIGARVADQVRDEDVARLLAEGHTVVLQAVHRLHEPVGRLARALADDVGHPVQVNAYITPPTARGFSAHYDTHDVFVVQCVGSKRWTLHDPVVAHPLPDDPWTDHRSEVDDATGGAPVAEWTLEPGDCLYLPAGTIHAAAANDTISVHLTFGVHAVRHTDLLRELFDAVLAEAEQEVEARAPLPIGWDGRASWHAAESVLDARDRLAAADGRGLIERLVARQVRDRARPEPLHVLAQADAIASASREAGWLQFTDLAPRVGVQARVIDDGDRAVLQTDHRSVPIDPRFAKVAQRVLDGDLGALERSGLTAAEVSGLVRVLLTEGLVVPRDASDPSLGDDRS